jgi:tetratricopeptide (TPR) repeat protein
MADERETVLLQLGHLRAGHDLPAARALVEAWLQTCPDDPYWTMENATQHLFEGDTASAHELFTMLAGQAGFGGALECMLKSAELSAGRGEFATALEMLSAAQARYPDYDGVAAVRRQVERQAVGTRREPVRDAVLAVRNASANPAALRQAIKRLQAYAGEAPDDLEMLLELGRLHRLDGQPGEAVKVLRRPADADGFAGQLESLIELARACEATGDRHAAWRVAQEIGRRFPRHAAFSTLAVELLARHGRAGEAIRCASQAFGALEPAQRAEALAALAEARATRIFETTLRPDRMGIADLVQPAHAPLDAAGIVILTKDEADILGHNLRHHYRIGFRHFCIVDNASTDATASTIACFRQEHPDTLVFSCLDPVSGHYQADKMRVFADLFAAYARIAGITLDWMFFLDTDELIACAAPADADALRAAMGNPGHDILVFHWLLCASPQPLRTTPPDASPFQSFPVIKPTRPPTSKVALRVNNGCRPTEGNHWVLGFEGSPGQVWIAAEHGWFMFHFMIRSFEQLRSKVENGGRAFQNTTGLETHGGHWKARYERFLRDGDDFIETLLRDHVSSTADGGSRLSP